MNHVEIYLRHFGYDKSDWIKCELPECGQEANEIHHIIYRSKIFGDARDHISNLMALCSEHHYQEHFIKKIPNLKEIHINNLKQHGKQY